MLIKFGVRLFLFFVVLAIAPACKNIFIGFTDYSTDDAKFSQAMTYLNNSEFDKAITAIQSTTSAFQSRRQTRYIMASAYAGKCGLNTVELILSFDDIGSTRLFPFLLSAFPAKILVNQTACQDAEMQLRYISENPSLRSAGENFLMVLIAFAKIGVIFSKAVDDDDNGVLDGFGAGDHCTDPTMVSDADVNELITGMAQVIHSLPLAGTTFGGAELSALTDACDALEALDPDYNFCNVADVDDATAEHRYALRSVMGSNVGVGLGNCNGDLTVCECFP